MSTTELRNRFRRVAADSNSVSQELPFKDGEVRTVVKQAIRDALADSSLLEAPTDFEVIRGSQNTARVDKVTDSIVIICGTAFIMADARAEIGIIEAKDADIVSDNNPTNQFKDSQVSNNC